MLFRSREPRPGRRAIEPVWYTGRTMGRFAARTVWWLIAVGLVLMLYEDLGNGAMVLLCGYFLRLAGRGTTDQAELERVAGGLRVGDVMEPVGPLVSPTLTLDTFAEQLLDGEARRVVVLVGHGSEVAGLLGRTQLRRLPRGRWATTRVEEVMVPRDRIAPVRADDEAWPILLQIGRANV